MPAGHAIVGLMAQTRVGARKTAAKKAGVSVGEYQRRAERGEKWCTLCRRWHPRDAFTSDASRFDGLSPSCARAQGEWRRARYRAKARPTAGRSFVPARDGDVRQARRRVNFFVESGLLPHPNSRACEDCGHVWRPGATRHEYDHHLGYDAQHHEHVEAVCARCHHARERARKCRR